MLLIIHCLNVLIKCASVFHMQTVNQTVFIIS